MQLVEARLESVRSFLEWARRREIDGKSNLLMHRPDINESREAVTLFPEPWWGIVVYTCFGSLPSARRLTESFREPLPGLIAEEVLAGTEFAYPKVSGHRIQQGLAGAKKALVAASDRAQRVHEILVCGATFDERYELLRAARLSRWGRTTCFDLVLRAGALGIGGRQYGPEVAYLNGSTGPKAGFKLIWDRSVSDDTAPWCEGLLQTWHTYWSEVAKTVGVDWDGPPYAPGDFENALCIYQH